jgi:Putative zinc-finger
MTTDRHEPYDELISASLTGDLTDDERRRLDLHLDGCDRCRATLASFADQRRVVSGLRHLAPPSDLGARVRTGIELGAFAPIPWWRRPAAIFAGVGGGLALVAGALFALVVFNGQPNDPEVGQPTPTPTQVESVAPAASDSIAPTPSPAPTLPPPVTPAPSGVPPTSPTPTPSGEATPEPTSTASPQPDVYLALTGEPDDLALTVLDGATGDTVTQVADTPSGEPIAAELSPDAQWLAYVTRVGESGLTEVRATRIAVLPAPTDPGATPPIESDAQLGDTFVLGESVEGSPFLERLAWSTDGRFLAYTLADPDGGGTDAWLFQPAEPTTRRQLTDVGDAYAASWVPGDDDRSLLWISVAGEEPVSHLREFRRDIAVRPDPVDPADDAVATAEGVFLPLLSPNGRLAIYWTGVMQAFGDEWLFSEAGVPYLSEHRLDGDEQYTFPNERPLFSDVTIGRDAFASGAIGWGPDGDAYAVWQIDWTGTPQSDDGSPYPDPQRVYFGHATDPRGLTRSHAIDVDDIPEDGTVVDVKTARTGRHLVITVLEPTGGVLEAPRAALLLVERNTGEVADDVERIGDSDDGWFGPAALSPYLGESGDR